MFLLTYYHHNVLLRIYSVLYDERYISMYVNNNHKVATVLLLVRESRFVFVYTFCLSFTYYIKFMFVCDYRQ